MSQVRADYRSVRVPQKPSIFQHRGGIASYPAPKEGVWPKILVPYRPLLGFLPPPEDKARPEPRREPLPPPPEGWVRTHHAASAAYPRLYREGHGNLGHDSQPWGTVPDEESKEERAKRLGEWCETLVRGRYDSHAWSLEEAKEAAPPRQWISVERWARKEPVGGYTLVCTHAGGLQKEHWHTIIREIISHDPSAPAQAFGGGPLGPHNVRIDEVWMMDDLHHNESVYLSDGRLGPLQSWEDTGRDFLNLVAHVVTSAPACSDRPWDLPWSPTPEVPRKVIGLGHSFGGAAICHAAHARPELFAGICLVDPVPVPWYLPKEHGYPNPTAAFPVTPVVLKRRDTWPSRRAARELLASNPFFAAFDPEQFDVYLARALIPVDPSNPEGEVTLATPIWAEACTFTEPEAGARAWDKLPSISVPIGWIMAGNSATTYGDKRSQQMVHRPPRARNERWLQAEHLLVQEKPRWVAESLWRFLATLDAGEWDAPSPDTRDANL
ncbi:hypothetical protein A1Q2_07403 [Trichosporon asahii var. asahii CBS 8904]|uniref:AB hydrolase-1 domain-containing protein n=1 Tax=Trichosporon asahii var. asahii (strain CBS 8904) TaxID=1220162 RepID=K1V371_TRIAC|nr:hypothetical protein A1Q2_07403 [Trichosporon asahii var. asahii CBS 8904]